MPSSRLICFNNFKICVVVVGSSADVASSQSSTVGLCSYYAGYSITAFLAFGCYLRGKGNPKRLTQSAYQHPNMDCGIWQCEVGAWNIVFSENKQEFFQVIEGIVRLHDAQGQSFVEIKAGEAGIIPPGFVGAFEVVEAVKKYYVVVES